MTALWQVSLSSSTYPTYLYSKYDTHINWLCLHSLSYFIQNIISKTINIIKVDRELVCCLFIYLFEYERSVNLFYYYHAEAIIIYWHWWLAFDSHETYLFMCDVTQVKTAGCHCHLMSYKIFCIQTYENIVWCIWPRERMMVLLKREFHKEGRCGTCWHNSYIYRFFLRFSLHFWFTQLISIETRVVALLSTIVFISKRRKDLLRKVQRNCNIYQNSWSSSNSVLSNTWPQWQSSPKSSLFTSHPPFIILSLSLNR